MIEYMNSHSKCNENPTFKSVGFYFLAYKIIVVGDFGTSYQSKLLK